MERLGNWDWRIVTISPAFLGLCVAMTRLVGIGMIMDESWGRGIRKACEKGFGCLSECVRMLIRWEDEERCDDEES